MNWIRIEERLPPQDICVLTCIYDTRPKVNSMHVEILYRLDNRWFEPRDGNEVINNSKYGKITHWMPIPDTPN